MKPQNSELYVRRFLKGAAVIALLAGFIVLGSHIWFVRNAKRVLKEVVSEKSRGKLKLELSELHFNIITNKGQIGKASITSTDSISQPITYQVKFSKLYFRIQSFWKLILDKEFLLDSITVQDPEIFVVQHREDTSGKFSDPNLSLPQEMGKLYHSMIDGFAELDISRINISNAKLTLMDRSLPGSGPVTVSDIFFQFQRKHTAENDPVQFIKTLENVQLLTSNQHIKFPDGRHQLSFSKFNLQLVRKRIELDSCTISVLPTNKSGSRYSIFFDRLILVGADFDAMYRHNLIRADSVYSESPFFDITLANTGGKQDAEKKERPDLEKIVRELTGDLDLQFVGMKNAGIHLNITGNKKRSLFNSSKDNFEIRGFRIKPDSAQPVSIERFDMLVRDYHLYNEDSSTVFSFDSVHFVNNRIRLNNFTVLTKPGLHRLHNERDFRIPYFELKELDWAELFFEQNLQAKEAVLFDPVINYRRVKLNQGKKKFSLYQMLHTVDSLMTLNKVTIINGHLNVELSPTISFIVEHLNMALNSNNLMKSTDRRDLRKSLDSLYFQNGLFRVKDIHLDLQQLYISKDNLLHCDKLVVLGKRNNIQAQFTNVYLDNPIVGDQEDLISVDGMRWESGTITLDSSLFSPSKKSGRQREIFLKQVSGRNTALNINFPGISVSAKLPLISMKAFTKKENQALVVSGLLLKGNQLQLASGYTRLSADSFLMASGKPSTFSGLYLSRLHEQDSLLLTTSKLEWTPDINGMFSKQFYIGEVNMVSPKIMYRKEKSKSENPSQNNPKLTIDHIVASSPDIRLTTVNLDSITSMHIKPSDKSKLDAHFLVVENKHIQLGSMALQTNSASYDKTGVNPFAINNGQVYLKLSDLELNESGGRPNWKVTLERLNLLNPDTFFFGAGAAKLSVDHIDLGNIDLSKGQPINFKKILARNLTAWFTTGTGKYSDSNKTVTWYNAGYNAADRSIAVDSIRYVPNMSKEDLLGSSLYQKDYITFSAGPVLIKGFDPDKYAQDSILNLKEATITDARVTVYRDKKPPFYSGIIKPLPVTMITNILSPISIEKINVNNGLVSYTEKHAKTRADGTLLLSRINGSVGNFRNIGLDGDDSLAVHFTTYVMDTALLDLKLKESYSDSLHGFVVNMRMKPTTVAFLNPVLAPLANIRIMSGMIDSFHLKAVAREDFSFGELNLFYHDLKVRLIKDGDPSRSTFTQKLGSIALNAFFVKTNNYGKKGIIYFERLKDRSFFNYLVKMTLSGIASSVGVKKNRKYMKKFHREYGDRPLPVISFDEEL